MTATHPGSSTTVGLRLYGKRIVLRPLVAQDFAAWSEVRRRNGQWLSDWEPLRPVHHPDPSSSRDIFAARCAARDRERHSGVSYSFGFFVDGSFAGEINLNNVMRGALQTGTVGYWVDRARAGHGFVAEAVVVLMKFAFEELHLHRLEVCIIPRNHNSLRVMHKLGIREEGIAQRFLEINGVWEDHARFGITIEEWGQRRADFTAHWLQP